MPVSSRKEPPPASVRASADTLKIFISYSRADMAFADEVVAGLEFDGTFDVMIDRHDIHEGEEWRKRLGSLIAAADTVVFVLSQKSAASPICRWEVEHAKSLAKRIIPVQAEALGGLEVPEALAALNYVRFDEGRSFMAGLTGLRRALKTDIDWLREHTRLLMRAQEWDGAGRADNRLLSGPDIVDAKAWVTRSPAEGLQPTELHRDFIRASEEAEAVRLSAERERAEKLGRAVKRTRIALAGAVVLGLAAGGAGLVAWQLRQTAEANAEQAAKMAGRAEKVLAELVKNLPSGWASDTESPDYKHLSGTRLGRELAGSRFTLTPDVIDLLIEANSFGPTEPADKLILALRGAVTETGLAVANAPSLALQDVRPDHKTFRSVFVVFDKTRRTLSAFPGSTEPNANSIRLTFLPELRAKLGFGDTTRNFRNNLLPVGLYAYVVGPHGGRRIPGNLRQTTVVAVRRSLNDFSYRTDDVWDVAMVMDNLHPSFKSTTGEQFSSFGSLTVEGKYDQDKKRFVGAFDAFRRALGLVEPPEVDHGRKFEVVVLTGLDAAVASALLAGPVPITEEDRKTYLVRLRQGSKGELVKKLQTALGLEPAGVMGATTVKRLAEVQTEKLGWSDGVYSPEMDKALGFCVLSGAPC